jgi:hypothetical protein
MPELDKRCRPSNVSCSRPGVRAKIDAIVKAAIPNERCLVVAHSLGTIVA